MFLKGKKEEYWIIGMFISVHWDRPKHKRSGQDVRPGKQTLTDFGALSLINGFYTPERTTGNGANSCWRGS